MLLLSMWCYPTVPCHCCYILANSADLSFFCLLLQSMVHNEMTTTYGASHVSAVNVVSPDCPLPLLLYLRQLG
jgi:hypothetical protein